MFYQLIPFLFATKLERATRTGNLHNNCSYSKRYIDLLSSSTVQQDLQVYMNIYKYIFIYINLFTSGT